MNLNHILTVNEVLFDTDANSLAYYVSVLDQELSVPVKLLLSAEESELLISTLQLIFEENKSSIFIEKEDDN